MSVGGPEVMEKMIQIVHNTITGLRKQLSLALCGYNKTQNVPDAQLVCSCCHLNLLYNIHLFSQLCRISAESRSELVLC